MDTILFNENNTEPVRSTVNFSSLLHSVGTRHVGIQGERIFPMLNDFFMSCSFSLGVTAPKRKTCASKDASYFLYDMQHFLRSRS